MNKVNLENMEYIYRVVHTRGNGRLQDSGTPRTHGLNGTPMDSRTPKSYGLHGLNRTPMDCTRLQWTPRDSNRLRKNLESVDSVESWSLPFPPCVIYLQTCFSFLIKKCFNIFCIYSISIDWSSKYS
jgi:hypothetical protein